MDFTFINCHLSSRITIDVPSATALALGLDCQQLQLQNAPNTHFSTSQTEQWRIQTEALVTFPIPICLVGIDLVEGWNTNGRGMS